MFILVINQLDAQNLFYNTQLRRSCVQLDGAVHGTIQNVHTT